MSDRLTSLTTALQRLGCVPADGIALVILTLATLASMGLLWVLANPGAAGSSPTVPVAVPGDSPSESAAVQVTDAQVIVHVAGAVRQPGVYTLAGGSRVGDAVTAAGGPRRRAVLDGLNLARVLTDGEQVLVPSRGEVDARAPAPGAAPAAAAEPGSAGVVVSLNQATPTDLETLPNIGPVLAQRIIDHRDSIGGFTDLGQLRDVPGIGEKTFQALADLVSL